LLETLCWECHDGEPNLTNLWGKVHHIDSEMLPVLLHVKLAFTGRVDCSKESVMSISQRLREWTMISRKEETGEERGASGIGDFMPVRDWDKKIRRGSPGQKPDPPVINSTKAVRKLEAVKYGLVAGKIRRSAQTTGSWSRKPMKPTVKCFLTVGALMKQPIPRLRLWMLAPPDPEVHRQSARDQQEEAQRPTRDSRLCFMACFSVLDGRFQLLKDSGDGN